MKTDAPLEDFVLFGRHALESRDIDPVYPVLRRLISDLSLDRAEAEWLVVLYLAYYELSSALQAFLAFPDPTTYAALRLPTGVERRGLRGIPAMRAHIEDWISRFNGETFFEGAEEAFGPNELHNNDVLDAYFRSVRHNGRWAAYKGCEVMHKVRGWHVRARSAGYDGATGPREGLGAFYPTDGPPAVLDARTDELRAACEERGVPLEVEEIETVLCDFNSLLHGRYYVGHDVDLMLEGAVSRPGYVCNAVLRARRVLPEEYRGELHGWRRRDKKAAREYAEHRIVLVRVPPDGHFEPAT